MALMEKTTALPLRTTADAALGRICPSGSQGDVLSIVGTHNQPAVSGTGARLLPKPCTKVGAGLCLLLQALIIGLWNSSWGSAMITQVGCLEPAAAPKSTLEKISTEPSYQPCFMSSFLFIFYVHGCFT